MSRNLGVRTDECDHKVSRQVRCPQCEELFPRYQRHGMICLKLFLGILAAAIIHAWWVTR